MGRIIAVTNIKGGIGKTTTVINVGAGLALKGARVLLVDVDAQGNVALSLGVSPRRTISQVLVEGIPAADCLTPARPNLDVLAADDTLLSAQIALAHRSNWGRTLQHLLSPLKESYDFLFIDAPGSLTPLTINALLAANEILVPTTVEHLSIKGLAILFKQVARITVGSSIVRMIVPTMYDARLRQSSDLLGQLRTTYGELVADPIRINTRLSESTAQGRTIYEYDARSRGALDYAHLVNRLGDMWGFQKPATRPGEQKPPATGAPAVPTPPPSPAATPATRGENGRSKDTPAPQPSPPPQTPSPPTPALRRITPLQKSLSTRLASTTKQSPHPPAAEETPLPRTCPHCGTLLKRTTLAGYRVVYCDNCKYKQQALANEMHY